MKTAHRCGLGCSFGLSPVFPSCAPRGLDKLILCAMWSFHTIPHKRSHIHFLRLKNKDSYQSLQCYPLAITSTVNNLIIGTNGTMGWNYIFLCYAAVIICNTRKKFRRSLNIAIRQAYVFKPKQKRTNNDFTAKRGASKQMRLFYLPQSAAVSRLLVYPYRFTLRHKPGRGIKQECLHAADLIRRDRQLRKHRLRLV